MNVHSTRSAAGALVASAILSFVLPRALAASSASGAGVEGPPIATELRPDRADRWVRVCSFRTPVCFHAAPGTPHPFQLAAVAAADRAWDAITRVLRVPAPAGALDDPWDVYLVDGVPGGARAVPDERDPQSTFDRESTFALVDRGTAVGCRLDFALARAIAEGSLRREAPATDLADARAQSEELARLATPCTPEGEDDAAFQADPWRCLLDPSSESFDRGASLFVRWVDSTFGSEPGAVVVGGWALAPTRTEPRARRWSAAPTTFDVLRTSLPGAIGRETTFDDVLVKFALARASIAPRPALTWSLPWPTRPRRITPTQPIAPTGVSYVRVDHRDVARGAKLRLEAQWEDYERMRWVVLKRDAAETTLSELVVTSTEHGTAASMTIEQLDGVDHILIVAQNLGSTEHPFNPDQGEWESHGWLLTLEGQPALGP
jgi:hypothetical protein